VALQPFEEVVAEHGSVVLRVCRALLDPADADDAWSETFLAALQAYPRLRPDSNVRGWLVTIAHRKAIDRIRVAARSPRPVGDVSHAASSHDESVDDIELRAALASLAPKQRAAVTYHYLADLPYNEIGAILGTTAAAARRSAADGIARLRRRLSESGTVER